jgi:ABC-2 type transport system permease protein/oleandomycin transport system permease protein
MSAIAAPTRPRISTGQRMRWAIADALVLTRRNLMQFVRVPPLLVFSIVQPIMFVLLFVFVFGGAISGLPPVYHSYVDYLMPGIFVQTAVFGSTQTGIGLAEDLNRGIVDRFRSLPMARSAVLGGRTASDAVRNLVVILLMTIVGYLVGYRFRGGALDAAAAVALAVAFGHAFSWVSAFIGLSIRDVESVQAASFTWIFPLTFASSAFVPVESMPGWLQAWAKVNPVSLTTNALRALTVEGLPVTRTLLESLAWIAGIIAVAAPLAIRKYRRLS